MNNYFSYDNNGNQTKVSPYGIGYDAENRQTGITISSSTTATYGYDGDGRRVTKSITGGSTTTYVYDAEGDLAAEYSTQPPAMPCATCYLTVDHVGSTRLETDQNGAVVARHDFLPFGEELTTSNRTSALKYGITDNVMHKYTGKERDLETGLDYFGARYFSGAQGRFTSPDPLMASARASDPQSWNRYAYARDNPLRYVDPDGMDVPDKCAKNPNCTIRVKVNVIYDTTANRGNGLTADQKKQFERGQLAQAQKDYGTSNIKLDVTYTAGTYTVDQNTGKTFVTGLQADALNIMASTGTPSGAAGDSSASRSTGTSLTFINVNDVTDTNKLYPFVTNTTEHELGHQFLGHPFLPEPNFLQYFGRELEVDARVKGQVNGISQTGFREGLEPRRYAVPANPEANKPRQ